MMTMWKQIPDFSRYEVSRSGKVRRHLMVHIVGGGNRLPPGGLLKQSVNKDGYVCFCLKRDDGKLKTIAVSVFVLMAFVGRRPSGHCALHANDLKTDNKLSNLYWGTQAQNGADRSRNGRVKRKLTLAQATEIRMLAKNGSTVSALAKEFQLDHTTVRKIILYKTYKY